MLAYLAYHVRASTFLLYFDSTVLALAYIFRIRLCPFVIAFLDLFLACLPWMPYIQALVAVLLVALAAHSRSINLCLC